MVLTVGYSEQSVREARVRWLLAFSLAALSACFLRLGYLQLIRGRALAQASESNHTQVLVERAPRGRILDRHGEVLAGDQPVFVALFSPLGLALSDIQPVGARLSSILKVPTVELERRLLAAVRAKAMMRVSDRLSRSQAFEILQDRIHLPGISLTVEEQRDYPKGTLASHLLGYVGLITEEELEQFAEQGYRAGDWIGKSGLERFYDPALHGQDGGFLMEVDARGRQVRVLRHILPRAGKDLILTLDHRLQNLAEERLRQTRRPGAAVVLDPRSGRVLVLASSPGFDPNVFLPIVDSEERKALLEDPSLPLYNRAIQALYPPGSTFKILTALSGFENAKIDLRTRFECRGFFELGREKRIFRCWEQKGHGWVNFRHAMAQSCDVYFYQLGQRLGPEAIEKTGQAFGLGRATGIDLPHEKKGVLPFAYRKARKLYWHGGETLNYAIGQGALQVTPIQMSRLIAAVANRGALWQPYLASQSHGFNENPESLGEPKMAAQLAYPETVWQPLAASLVDAVTWGTGGAARLKEIKVAGKTGTAQTSKGKDKDHGWFVAYAPAEDPQVACTVVVEHGGHGGSVAAPIAHDLLAMALGFQDNERPAPPAHGD